MGSLVHQNHRAEVLDKLQAGLAQGGNLVLGGNPPVGDLESGAFMEATVVTDVTRDNLLFHEELFDPSYQ